MSVKSERLKIVLYPHPVLRTKAHAVARVDSEVHAVAVRMIELMHEAKGIGLAAPQVGLPWRMFVANPTGEPGHDQVFINPKLMHPSEEIESMEEGCLSLPDIRAEIRRPQAITLEAHDLQGNRISLTSDTLPARVWQHEMDHLDGTLIIDRMSPLDRRAMRHKLKALETR